MVSPRHIVDSWLKKLGSQFRLDDSDRCFLQPDASTGIVIFAPDQGDDFFIYGDVMRVPDTSPPGFYERILSMNAKTSQTGGTALAMELSSSRLLVIYRQPTAGFDGQQFQNVVHNLPSVIHSLRSQLDDLLHECSADEAHGKKPPHAWQA